MYTPVSEHNKLLYCSALAGTTKNAILPIRKQTSVAAVVAAAWVSFLSIEGSAYTAQHDFAFDRRPLLYNIGCAFARRFSERLAFFLQDQLMVVVMAGYNSTSRITPACTCMETMRHISNDTKHTHTCKTLACRRVLHTEEGPS